MAALVPQTGGRTHLALTGRREFWPADHDVWLVSPSCVPTPPWEEGEIGQSKVLGCIGFPWALDGISQLHLELADTHSRLVDHLTERLNAMHGVERSRRYWGLVVGPWLFSYINLVAHHVHSLRKAQRELGDIESIGLHPDCEASAASTIAFLHNVSDDLFNLGLYTRVAGELGIPLVELRTATDGTRLADQENPENLPRARLPLLKRVMLALEHKVHSHLQRSLARRSRVLMWRSYLPQSFAQRLAVVSWGRIWPFIGTAFKPELAPSLSAGLRGALSGFQAMGETEAVIGALLPDVIPQVYVEHYPELVAFSERQYSGLKPNVVVSAVAWHDDEAYCHFAAERAEDGAVLVGAQHGGIERIEQHSQVVMFERSLVDYYLTWGWLDPEDERCIPAPATRLVNVRRRSPRRRGRGILYVGTAALRFPSIARPDFSGYFELQRRYFGALPPEVRRQIRVRLHTSDFGWGIERRLMVAYPDVDIERWNVTFSESLARSRMYVCDHLSTSFAEALASNTPSVIFWDPVFLGIHESARPVFDRARAARIVHDTPESAAEWVVEVYPEVEQWWLSPECQSAVDALCHQFARTSDTPLRDWMRILKRLGA